MMRSLNSQTGLGLIETLVAIFIIIVGLIGGLSLAVFSTSTATNVKERFVAYSLAQEGLELIRNRRDSEWLAGNDLFGNNNADYIIDYEGRFGPPGDSRLYYKNGFYSHDSVGSTATIYSRVIRRRHLPGPDDADVIVSEVTWGGNTVKLELRLFDWRDM